MTAQAAPARLLIARNLRAAERSRWPVWLRAAIVAAVIVALLAGHAVRAATGSPGRVLLGTVLWIDYWALVVAGITLFPALIAEEREQGSLSLLRLAGFRPLGYLLGQTLSAFVGCLLVLAVQVPFLLLAVALGGTSVMQVGTALLILLVHALVVYGAALLAGAASRTSRTAVRLALLLVPLVTFLPHWLEAIFGSVAPSLTSHLAGSLLTMLQEESLPAGAIGEGVALHLLLAALMALGAWLLFDQRSDVAPGPRRSTRSAARAARRRFPPGPKAFDALAQRIVFGRATMPAAILGQHVLAALFVLAIANISFAGELGLLLSLQTLITLGNAGTLATRCTGSVRRERVAGLLLLAGGPRLWLHRQRAWRAHALWLHFLAMLVTVLALAVGVGQSVGGVMWFWLLGWALAAGYFADRFGELGGLAVARGALAVTVLGGAAIVLVSTWCASVVLLATGSVFLYLFAACSLLVALGMVVAGLTARRLPRLYAA